LTSGQGILNYDLYFKTTEADMPRPRKCRRVEQAPVHTFYKPQGVALEGLTGLTLPVEGLEAMRLADAEQMDPVQAAALMEVSRPTFSRILGQARRIVARALSNGWAIHIDGGDYRVDAADSAAPCVKNRRRGPARGRCGGGPPPWES
jgi:uncharacterized protein